MPIKIGCFALIDPFTPFRHQLDRIRAMGFDYADVTDNSDGGVLGVEYGFSATVSLDANPFDIKRMFAEAGLTPTAYCAHANLLDPSAPWRYGTPQILKAIKAAAMMGIRHVVTAEGEPATDWGHRLTEKERLLLIRDRLHEPLRLAADCGVMLLLEPHGQLTDTVAGMESIFDALGDPPALGVNLDTGNCWLGGGDPVGFVQRFGGRIQHVHWKDLPNSMEAERGHRFGCGMGTIAVGEGAVDVAGVFRELRRCGFDGYTTLEVAGDLAVVRSRAYLESLESPT